MNKCLELRYIFRTWKVAALEVIPKPPGEDDYTCPKSYQPISLLPVQDEMPSKCPFQHGVGVTSGSGGSIAGPTFGNLILDSLLRELGELAIYVQAFANDVVFMLFRQSTSSVEEDGNRALAYVHCWRVKNKLKFAPSKTKSMVLTRKLKCDDPVVHKNGNWSDPSDAWSKFGGREDHIYHRDGAYSAVHFVHLGTGDREDQYAKDVRRCPS
ncbi:hypothetical protein EVAR_87069_1 [Eumeta japonica]|uniref:Reverse transcriptase domain-containing protein n=1 Tax=Eumeta variegata TaxID=151549 RepID=A0A4C1VNY0_EUMVA|nr:hypothetical protein EVAR_87069_1 [Eumeta japonica]